jgi:hypothetical protein
MIRQSLPLRGALAAALSAVLLAAAPARLAAERAHIVPETALEIALDAHSERRADDEAALGRVLGSDQARRTLAAAGLDAAEISAAASSLDDEQLAKLAKRARAFEADVAAGALNNQQITYILIALGTAVIILVIVAA